MGTAKWIRKGCTELIGDQVGGYGWGLRVIVSWSLCLPRQRRGNKWFGCHLEKHFNNSFVYGAGQKGLLWRAGHRWSSEWKKRAHKTHTHTHTCAHTYYTHEPTHMRTKKACTWDWLITWVHTICHGGWKPALYSHAENYTQTHVLVHKPNSFLFYNCSTLPPQRSFLAYWCAIVFMWASKIRIYQLIEMPASAFTYALSHTSAHISIVQYRKHKQASIYTLCICRLKMMWWLYFLSINHCVKLPVIMTPFSFLRFHIWLRPNQILKQPLKSNDATPTVTTIKALHPTILLEHIPVP